MKHVVFLRGINVGGNTKVPMKLLKTAFDQLGFQNVKTLLNSGNVIFETEEKDPDKLTQQVEKKLESVFGFKISVILRSQSQIQSLVDSDPFVGIKVTPDTRLYVTFLKDKPEEVCNVISLNPTQGTTDLMKDLDKKYAKNITTRNWNTVLKILR